MSHESYYEWLCIVINSKIRNVPLNILSSVYALLQKCWIWQKTTQIIYIKFMLWKNNNILAPFYSIVSNAL